MKVEDVTESRATRSFPARATAARGCPIGAGIGQAEQGLGVGALALARVRDDDPVAAVLPLAGAPGSPRRSTPPDGRTVPIRPAAATGLTRLSHRRTWASSWSKTISELIRAPSAGQAPPSWAAGSRAGRFRPARARRADRRRRPPPRGRCPALRRAGSDTVGATPHWPLSHSAAAAARARGEPCAAQPGEGDRRAGQPQPRQPQSRHRHRAAEASPGRLRGPVAARSRPSRAWRQRPPSVFRPDDRCRCPPSTCRTKDGGMARAPA